MYYISGRSVIDELNLFFDINMLAFNTDKRWTKQRKTSKIFSNLYNVFFKLSEGQ